MHKNLFRELLISLKFFLVIIPILNGLSYAQLPDRFKEKKLLYRVYFNGIPTGKILFGYLGRKIWEDREVEIVSIDSETKILYLLELNSSERVYLDVQSYLPVKVEREVVFWGREEFIEEFYHQEEGWVKITRNKSKTELIYQEKPIYNIVALLYFFPENIELKPGKELFFNLPTQKLNLKILGERMLSTDKGIRETYFLSGRGKRVFNLWLDKEERLPLRLEFILTLGKIVILRKD